jgi:N-methylhydantoinase A
LSFDLVQTRITLAGPECWPGIAAAFRELAGSAAEILDRERIPAAERQLLLGIDARYEGQNFEVPVSLNGIALDDDTASIDHKFVRRFRDSHAEIYGYDIPGRAVELVNLRLKMVGAVPKPLLAAPGIAAGMGGSEIGGRPVYFDAATGWVETPVHDGARLAVGAQFAGPAIVEEMSATTVLHPGQSALVDAAGNLIITVGSG